MENIKALRKDKDYEWALAQIETYFDRLPVPGTADADRFDVLADLISAYEARHWPIDEIDPVTFLDGYMQNKGLSQSDLARVLGSTTTAADIMTKRTPLTLAMIQRLIEHWHVPAEALVQPYPVGAGVGG